MPLEILEQRQVLSAVSLGVVDDNMFKLDANTANDASVNAANTEIDFNYGIAGDTVVMGNWIGNGTFPAIVRQPGQNGAPNDGLVHWYFDVDGDAETEFQATFGLTGDNPVVGDWNGDGKDDIGVTRKSGGIGVANDGLLNWFLASSFQPAPTSFSHRKYGFSSDSPVVGNWDGKAKDDLGIVRTDALGNLTWMQDWTGDAFPERTLTFGRAGDIPVTGDWDGDGLENIGLARTVGGLSLQWILDTNNNGSAPEIVRILNTTGTKPVVGNWNLAEINVDGIADGQTHAVLIGIAAVGQVSSRPITIRNTGTKPLTLGTPAVTGNFAVTTNLPKQLAPGATADFTITFRPQSEGPAVGSVQIPTNDGNEMIFDFPVFGRTPAPEISVSTNNGQTRLTNGQATVIDVGSSLQNDLGPLISFRITNDGELPLSISNVVLPSGFEQVGTTSTLIAPGSYTILQARLLTTVVGTKQGQVLIYSNDSDENPFNFNIRGVVAARAPEIRVMVDGLEIEDGRTTPIDLGTALRGTTTQEKNVDIWNDGSSDLTLSAVTLSGSGFTVISQPAARVAPGTKTTLIIRLDNAVAGSKTAIVRFNSNDGDEAAFDFSLKGTVAVPAAEITVVDVIDGQLDTISFGTVNIGATGPVRTFTIRNDGNISLSIGSVNVPSGFLLVTSPAKSIDPGDTTSFSIQMSTNAAGTTGGTVSFTTNDADESPFNFNIAGTVNGAATSPEIEVAIDGRTIAEGSVGLLNLGAAYGISTKTFEITNRGNAILTLSNLNLTGPYVIAGMPKSLAAGAKATVTISFKDSTLGLKAGTLQFNTNDSTGNESQIVIALKGKVFENWRSNGHVGNNGPNTVIDWSGAITKVEIQPRNGIIDLDTHYVAVLTFADGSTWRAGYSLYYTKLRIHSPRPVIVEKWIEGLEVELV